MPFDVGSAVGYLLLDTSNWTSGVNSARAGLKTLTDQTSTVSDKFTAMGTVLGSVGKSLTLGITTPLLGVGTAAMKVGNDFEAQMSRVQAIAGATAEEMELLNQQALDLGASTSFSASEAAQGMENLASAGFTVNEIMEAMPGLLDLAASSGADLATASEIAASAVRGFGLEAADTAHVADVFAEAAARTNAQVEDMGEAMKYIAPVANAMGQEIEMVAAAVGMMSDAGIKGSQAGTSLRGALSRLARPTDAMATTMKRYGLAFYDASGNMLDLVGIVDQLETHLSGLTQEQRNNALVTLFGQESLSGMLALMDRGSDELQAMTDAFKASDGAAADMADTMMNNTAGAIEEMSGAFETAAIRIQQALAPMVQSAAEAIGELVNKFNALDDSSIQIIVTIAGIVAALGPLLILIGKISSSIGSIITLIGGAGGLSTVITALTGPLGIVLAAVVALTAAWATNFGGIRDKTVEILNSISVVVSSFFELLTTIWNENFLGIQTLVTDAFTAIEDIFSNALNVLVSLFDTFAALFSGDWDTFWNSLTGLVDSVLQLLNSIISNGLNLIIDIILGFGSLLYDAATTLFDNLSQGAEDVWNDFIDWFLRVLQDPLGAVLDLAEDFFDAGADLINSLWDGAKSIWDNLVTWVNEKIDWLIDKITFWDNETAGMRSSTTRGEGFPSDGSYASGLDYVPRDMDVRVHEGESILTKQQTADLANLLSGMNSSGDGDLVINWYINGTSFSRAIIPDFRKVDASTPKVVNDLDPVNN